MRSEGDGRRLSLALLLSLLLHLLVLAFLPRLGWPAGAGSFLQDGPALLVSLKETALEGLAEPVPAAVASVPGQKQGESGPLAGSPEGEEGLVMAEDYGPPFPPPIPIYYFPADLEEPPRALTALPEEFPGLAGKIGAGRLVFSVLIDEHGRVDEVINESNSLTPEFVPPLREAIEKMRFVPGMKGGQPVKSRLRIEVNLVYSIYE
ncbi:MAG: energy transducer TonB [Rhodocyclaceae bacterium]|nr:energy transducer TonB [Rhodocyclaceae bacterium]